MSAPIIRSRVVLTQADNQCPITTTDLEAVVKAHAVFFRELLLSDTPTLNNPRLRDFFTKEPRWLDSGILVIALRDSCQDVLGLLDWAKKQGMYDLLGDQTYAERLCLAKTVPVNFERLAEHYTNRIDQKVSDPAVMHAFGFSDEAVGMITNALVREFEEKGYVTRTTLYELGDELPDAKVALRRFGDAHYWEGIPAILGTSSSITRLPTSPTELVADAIDSFMETATFREETQLDFPLRPAYLALDLDDVGALRRLTSFGELNDAIDNAPLDPTDEQLDKLLSRFVIHAENVSGYIALKTKKDPSGLARMRVRIAVGARHKSLNTILSMLSLVPVFGAIPTAISWAYSFWRDPQLVLREERALYIRKVLRSTSNETHQSSQVTGLVDDSLGPS